MLTKKNRNPSAVIDSIWRVVFEVQDWQIALFGWCFNNYFMANKYEDVSNCVYSLSMMHLLIVFFFFHLASAFMASIVYNASVRNHKRNFKCRCDIDFHFATISSILMQKMDCTTQESQIRRNERVSENPLHKWIVELFMRQHWQLSVINWMEGREREAFRNTNRSSHKDC